MALPRMSLQGTQWTLSNSALARVTNRALTATSAGTVTVQAAYVETIPAGNSPASADMSPENPECIHTGHHYRGAIEQHSF